MTASGAVAVVTGGASGIGQATVRVLAGRGTATVIGYLNSAQEAVKLADELDRAGSPTIAVRADVTDEAEVARLVDRALARFGRIDYLVNNAGATIARGPVEELPLSVWHRSLAVNLTSAYLMCRAAIPALRDQSGAAIVNVASSSGFTGGSRGSAHYAAAKAGLVGLTRALAGELAPFDIRVNAVAPASIDTPFHEKWPPATPPESWIPGLPLGRLGSPVDVADAIAFLLCDTAGFITGQTVHINGGSRMY
ncbi:SDR family oxidoreductase [Nonomuraea sp. K274]|uniref:SDR family oxidoreductase n=1 Tax=Nonomuraea cypriaca TaxID=1187855 RepID=A0A931A316_9ACTN|nr:SDR family NAD(P)-dependent oxidoreductase [Nonomuraea cypriaca]MBF8185322.1 SDR family oxidoreductase [Nonomuraea cypriaca]